MNIISTIAALVSIVGGLVGIISAVSKESVFTRLWQRQPGTMSQHTLQRSPSLSKPIGRVAPSTHTEDQSRQILPPNRVRIGLFYGMISSVLAVLVFVPTQVIYLQTNSSTFPLLALSAWIILSIADGILPSRVSGFVRSAGIAGGMLGLSIYLTAIFYNLFTHVTSTGSDLVLAYAVFGAPPFIISVLFGLLGRRLYKRLQVPAPNEQPLASRKQPSDTAAQQLQQAPYSPRHVQGNCPNCGASNAPGARFCSQCGTKL